MTEWLARCEKDGELCFRIGRDGGDLVAEWLGIVRLVARRDGSAHTLESDPNAPPRELAKVRRGGVQLLLRQLSGKIALHGASVAADGKAVVLLGRAGHGKSTLAAALCARGTALLSDDAVAIDPTVDGFAVTALEDQHWIDANARAAIHGLSNDTSTGLTERGESDVEGKVPIVAPRVAEQAELVAFVDLAFTDGPARLVRCTPLEAMAALVPQSVRFILDDPAVHRSELEKLGRLVETVPTFRLERPRDLALLSDSCGFVLDLLRKPTGASTEP